MLRRSSALRMRCSTIDLAATNSWLCRCEDNASMQPDQHRKDARDSCLTARPQAAAVASRACNKTHRRSTFVGSSGHACFG